MEDLRRCWKVPYIVYYCNLFEQKLDLIDLRVDEFEDALLDDCGNERNITIVHLLQKLIKPFTNRSIDLTNFDQYLLQVLRRYHLDFILASGRKDDSQKSVYNSWNSLSILAKLDIIFRLCELRLSLNDIETKLSDYEASELRLEPLAVDSAGTRLWYFGDLRLYEERKPERRPKSKVVRKKVEKKAARSTRSSRRLRAKDEQQEEEKEEPEEEEESEEEVDVDVEELDTHNYEETLRKELKYWSCVCQSLDEWYALNERLKGSTKQQDEEIGELIESQYLPEMPALFQKADREKQQRLQAMQPKRQSQRLQSKQVVSLSENECDVMASDEFSKLAPEEQERVRREEIARAREQRLQQRLAKRDNALNDSNNDEISQDAHSVRSTDSDFNIKNYFLMYKVLQKVLQCKYSWPFKDAVSEEDAPDYNSIIQNPMDLSTIQLKINNKIYKSRREFISDLELIVQNCLTYNGDDTFYGKLAVKFENFFKRWLQIFYPREISASLEEKNRQLMKLMNGSDLSAENGDEHESQNGADAAAADDTNSLSLHTNENSQLAENDAATTTQPIDFSDTSFLHGTMRKKRKPNPDKDKYIQEPEYVTKRTSSGRLVKMKISTEFDYASDEERPGPGRPRKRDLDLDDGTHEGIQQRHCKSPSQAGHYASSSDSDQDEDEDDDFTGRSKHKTGHKKSTRKYVRKRDQFGNLIPRRPKKTIADLTGPVRPGLAHIFESGEDESCLETRRHLINPANILRQQSSNLNLQTNGEYSFEQYVKKINSNCTVGQALAVADAVKAACSTSPDKSQVTARPPPLRISAASTSAAKLTIPVINPSIKATLGRIQQQPLVVSSANENGKVKLISVNGSGGGGGGLAGKRLLIINNSTGGQSKPVVLNNGASNFKIINIKSASGSVSASRPLLMINKSLGAAPEVRVEKKMESEAGGPGERVGGVDSGPGEPVTSVKGESEVNGHVN